jgi:hypothetical protein
MAAVTPARAQPQSAERQRHIIDGNEKVSGNFNLEMPAKPNNGFTGKIHVTFRISQDELVPPVTKNRGRSLATPVFREPNREGTRHPFD